MIRRLAQPQLGSVRCGLCERGFFATECLF
jgi:hypothetical protein